MTIPRGELLLNGEAEARAAGELAQAHPTGFRFEPVTLEELAARARKPEWMVRRVLVAGQPFILGGPRKSLKTSILIDLAVSLATGTPFLGAFDVPRPRRVCMVSGESGEFNILTTARRVCTAKGVSFADAGENLRFDFRLPQLANVGDLKALQRGLTACRAELVILDPLYLCLLAGGGDDSPQASNLFEMGPLYLNVARTCLDVGCTPALAHHFKTTRADHNAQPDLADLAYAGVQEFVRQWGLVGRREPFEPGAGEHRLWLVAGGSVGHSGCWAVDVDEGQLDDDFGGRKWAVRIITEAEAIAEKEGRKAEQQNGRREQKERDDETKVLSALDRFDPDRTGLSKTKLRSAAHIGDKCLKEAVERLLDGGFVEVVSGTVAAGNGATKSAELIRRRSLADHPSGAPDG